MLEKKENKFALYLKVKEQQRDCNKYLKAMVQVVKEQQVLFSECAVEMA